MFTASRRPLAALAAAGVLLPACVAASAPAEAAPPASRAGKAVSGEARTAVAAQDVRALVARMTVRQKVGQLFVQQVYGSSAAAADRRNLPLYGVATPAQVVAKYHLGGIVYFGWAGQLSTPARTAALSNGLQRAALTSGARVPLQIATDQEQGPVRRLGPPATELPGAMALGAGRSTADARSAAAITGSDLRAVGIDTNYAPVADVNVNPANPVIGVRAFGGSTALVASMVAAQVAGFEKDANVSTAVKHFPGHGDTSVDSHTGLPVISHGLATWNRVDAPPFRSAVAAGTDLVMTGHLVVPALDPSGEPATLSRPIVTDTLRGRLGFRGVVVSDSLAMAGVRSRHSDGEVAVRAVLAGVDQLLMPPKMGEAYSAVLGAVASGRISRARLDASVTRILTLKRARGLFARPYVDVARVARVVGTRAHAARAEAIANRGVTLLRRDPRAAPFAPRGRRVAVVGFGADVTAGLATELTRRGARTTRLVTGATPTAAQQRAAVAAARRADRVVVTTMNASRPAGAAQRRLVAALRATGRPVAVVAVREPYDLAALPATRTYLATYGWGAVSGRAAARVLSGAIRPQGRLPVSLPAAGGGTLAPYGSGLR